MYCLLFFTYEYFAFEETDYLYAMKTKLSQEMPTPEADVTATMNGIFDYFLGNGLKYTLTSHSRSLDKLSMLLHMPNVLSSYLITQV